MEEENGPREMPEMGEGGRRGSGVWEQPSCRRVRVGGLGCVLSPFHSLSAKPPPTVTI